MLRLWKFQVGWRSPWSQPPCRKFCSDRTFCGQLPKSDLTNLQTKFTNSRREPEAALRTRANAPFISSYYITTLTFKIVVSGMSLSRFSIFYKLQLVNLQTRACKNYKFGFGQLGGVAPSRFVAQSKGTDHKKLRGTTNPPKIPPTIDFRYDSYKEFDFQTASPELSPKLPKWRLVKILSECSSSILSPTPPRERPVCALDFYHFAATL